MSPEEFLSDLELKPQSLVALADLMESGELLAPLSAVVGPGTAGQPVRSAGRQVVMVGMGSSTYAGALVAARMRRGGINAVADLASSELLPSLRPDALVVAISASGESRETLDALDRLGSRAPVVAITNSPESTLANGADVVVDVRAGVEKAGVASRSFQHTLIAMLALEQVLTDQRSALAGTVRRAAAASEHLLASRGQWLDEVTQRLSGGNIVGALAPASRLSSAQQSALMLREGPRINAVASETGEWSHVDVYLTKTMDYRMLLLPGSPYQAEALRWARERGSTVVAVGEDVPDAAHIVRYMHDDDTNVRLITEVLVAELVAQQLWTNQLN